MDRADRDEESFAEAAAAAAQPGRAANQVLEPEGAPCHVSVSLIRDSTMRALTAMTTALALSACAAEGQDDPIRAFAKALSVHAVGNPSCPFSSAGGRSQSSPGCANADQIPQELTHRLHGLGTKKTASLQSDHGSESEAESTRIPALKIEANCRLAVELGADVSLSRCVLVESTAHSQLTQKWTEFPASDRSQCLRYSTGNGGGTYTDLLTCLEMDFRAGELHAKNRSIARR
jgi:hypothetical protein